MDFQSGFRRRGGHRLHRLLRSVGFPLRTIGLSTAYAIWAGVGTVGVVLAGVLIFGEHLSVMAIVGIGLVVIGVVLLNLAVPH